MNKQIIQSSLAILLLTGMHFASGLDSTLERGAMLERLLLTDMSPWTQSVAVVTPNAIDRSIDLQGLAEHHRELALHQLSADLQGGVQQPTLPSLPALQIGAFSLDTALASASPLGKRDRPLLDLKFLHFSLRR